MNKQPVFRKTIDFDEAKDLLEQIRTDRGYPSGYGALDKLCGGLVKDGLTLVCARPGMGNTSMVLNLADRQIQRQEGTVLIIAPGARQGEIAARLLSIGTMLPDEELIAGTLPAEFMGALFSAYYNNREGKVKTIMHSDPSLDEIWEFSLQTPNLRMVIVDSIEHISKPIDMSAKHIDWNPGREDPETVVRSLKKLAYTLDVPVLCTVRMHRSLEKRKNKRPRLSDLQEVGIPEDGADQVIFLYRDRYYDYQGEEGAEWIVAKSPQGKTGTVCLDWNYQTGCFDEGNAK